MLFLLVSQALHNALLSICRTKQKHKGNELQWLQCEAQVLKLTLELKAAAGEFKFCTTAEKEHGWLLALKHLLQSSPKCDP